MSTSKFTPLEFLLKDRMLIPKILFPANLSEFSNLPLNIPPISSYNTPFMTLCANNKIQASDRRTQIIKNNKESSIEVSSTYSKQVSYFLAKNNPQKPKTLKFKGHVTFDCKETSYQDSKGFRGTKFMDSNIRISFQPNHVMKYSYLKSPRNEQMYNLHKFSMRKLKEEKPKTMQLPVPIPQKPKRESSFYFQKILQENLEMTNLISETRKKRVSILKKKCKFPNKIAPSHSNFCDLDYKIRKCKSKEISVCLNPISISNKRLFDDLSIGLKKVNSIETDQIHSMRPPVFKMYSEQEIYQRAIKPKNRRIGQISCLSFENKEADFSEHFELNQFYLAENKPSAHPISKQYKTIWIKMIDDLLADETISNECYGGYYEAIFLNFQRTRSDDTPILIATQIIRKTRIDMMYEIKSKFEFALINQGRYKRKKFSLLKGLKCSKIIL